MRTVYTNGSILTMERETYAQAVVTRDDRIEFVGSIADMPDVSGARRVDLGGRTLMPAFVDAHSHFIACADAEMQVALDGADTPEEIARRIRAYIDQREIPPGQWIRAQGYDQNLLPDKAHPDRKTLDCAAPQNPLVVSHKSGHMGVFNTRALEALGISADAPTVDGGTIDPESGLLQEAAYLRYVRMAPMPGPKELLAACARAQQRYFSHGIVLAQDGMAVREMLPLYQMLAEDASIQIDLVGYPEKAAYDDFARAFPSPTRNFRLGGVKMILDGSPQGRTAWMRAPYSGTDDCGFGTLTDAAVCDTLRFCANRGVQPLAHCNGDRAAEQFLNALERVAKENPEILSLRPVMIHAQLLGLDQLATVRRLSVIPSFFVAHVYEWGDAHIENFGLARARHISPARSAMDAGIRFTFHQDSPVLEMDMLKTVSCAAERRTRSGVSLGPEERIPVLNALRAVTVDAAYQYFLDGERGSLRPGKRADFAILDANPLATDPARIAEISVLETIQAGRTVFAR